jgi:hypothetical protein
MYYLGSFTLATVDSVDHGPQDPPPSCCPATHLTGENTQAAPLHVAAVAATCFGEVHVRAAGVGATETGPSWGGLELTWKPWLKWDVS